MNTNALLYITLFLMVCAASACTYAQKVRDGRTAYERMQFAVAAPMLQKEFNKAKKASERGKLAFMLAESLRRSNQAQLATDWYKTAYENQYGIDALREYAFALKKNERYAEAQEIFNALGLEIGSPYEYKGEIAACKVAQTWLTDAPKSGYTLENLSFNSADADYAPCLLPDGKVIFSSDRQNTTNKDIVYKWTGKAFSDFFVVEKNNQNAMLFSDIEGINSLYNEGTIAFNNDASEVVFARCGNNDKNDDYCKLYYSQKTTSGWTQPKLLPFAEQDGVNYAHPAFSKDGKTLYFACNRTDGWGGYDIYYVERKVGTWAEPQVLSRSINTEKNDMFPSIDNDTLYFASEGHTGMGGLDVFKTYRLKNGQWSPAYNLKSPINSGSDDFGFIIDAYAPKKQGIWQAGYFSSNRPNGKGSDDIYRFEWTLPEKPILAVVTNTPNKDTIQTKPIKPLEQKIILEGYILEKIYANATDPNSKVLGRKPLGGASVQTSFGGKSQPITLAEDGSFSMVLEKETDYHFFASKTEYLNNDKRFSTKGIALVPEMPVQKFTLEIVLDKIFKDKEIVLENIYYDYDKWDIRTDARPTLDALVGVLSKNPTIKIQLSSHTDCRGKDTYNETLSQRRAQSAVDYLIQQGVEPSRLVAKGYGETSPALSCGCNQCTEAEHQANRRTTFKVLN